MEDGLLSLDEENALTKCANHFGLTQQDLDGNGVQTSLVQAAVFRKVTQDTSPQHQREKRRSPLQPDQVRLPRRPYRPGTGPAPTASEHSSPSYRERLQPLIREPAATSENPQPDGHETVFPFLVQNAILPRAD